MTDRENVSARGRAPERDEAGLRARLRDDDVSVRRNAALGLVDRDTLDTETVGVLVERLIADADADVRQFAVEALGTAGVDASSIEPALNDPDEWVRAEAVVALSRTGGMDSASLARDALSDDAGAVRRNALIALAKLDAVAPETLRERLKTDPHGPVREYAAKWLGDRPGEVSETVTLLAAVLARDKSAFVRANAARSLGELGTDRAIEALEAQGVADRSDDVQRAAKRALATARGKSPDQLDLDDAPAPGGGPATPGEHPNGNSCGLGGYDSSGPNPTGRGPRTPPSNATRRSDGGEDQ